jgi:hypothetical protein
MNSQRVVGQEEAISAVADAIRRNRAGLSDEKNQSEVSFSSEQRELVKPNWQKLWQNISSMMKII